MEALFEFTQMDQHRNVFDLYTKIESTANALWNDAKGAVFHLNKTNYVTLLTDVVSEELFQTELILYFLFLKVVM